MDINKIHVTVDRRDYIGLYWITEEEGNNDIHVSYAGVKKISKPINKTQMTNAGAFAKEILSDLLRTM